MQDDPPVAEILEIGASTIPLLERARALVESLNRWLPLAAIWLTLSDPASNAYATVGTTGLERFVLDRLYRPAAAGRIRHDELNHRHVPVSVTKLPVNVDQLPTWADCLIPAGFREGLGVPLSEPGGLHVGMLSVLFYRPEPPSTALRDCLAQLAPLIARGVSPLRPLLTIAHIVKGAAWGVALLRDGTTHPLPGLKGHALLVAGSPVVTLAHQTLSAGHVYRSFLWPQDDGPVPTGHARMTVLAGADVPEFVLGAVVATPEVVCRGLTARELEVLGLVVDGRSNQQIARRLSVAPRTVAAHMEHILHKLEVPTRTMAAVLAEREGCHVPPPPGPQSRR